MKRISLAAGIVLLAFLATVAVGNHSAGGTDKPPVVAWKAVPYGPAPVPPGIGPTVPLVFLSFTVPEAGFVWLNSSGSCIFGRSAVTTVTTTFPPVGIGIGWRGATSPFGAFTFGDADINNITFATINQFQSLPYSASAVFPVSAGTNTMALVAVDNTGSTGAICTGVNVVMFTNTQLP